MNKITINGRLTKDPDLNNTTGGVTYSRFNIACKSQTKDSKGEPQTDFFSCVAWRTNAENLARFSKKGDLISVYGSMSSRKYEDKNGNTQTMWECNVDTFEFLSTRADREANKPSNEPADLQPIDEDDDNLPF